MVNPGKLYAPNNIPTRLASLGCDALSDSDC